MSLFSQLGRLWAVLLGKSNKVVTEAERANMESLLQLRVDKQRQELAAAQAGVAQSFAVVADYTDQLQKKTDFLPPLITQFKALHQAGSAKAADKAALIEKTRKEVAELDQKLSLAKKAADQNQRALIAARKSLEDSVAEAKRNINEAKINEQLANSLELATGLISKVNTNASELSRVTEMAREANNSAKGRIMASQGQMEASGLMESQEEENILKEDAAAKLAAELGLAPTKSKSADTATKPAPESPNNEKAGM